MKFSTVLPFFLACAIVRVLPAFDTVEFRWSIYSSMPDACFEYPWNDGGSYSIWDYWHEEIVPPTEFKPSGAGIPADLAYWAA